MKYALVKYNKNSIKDGTAKISSTYSTIKRMAFANCDGLSYIAFPRTVEKVENCAFYNCRKLQSVIISNPETEVEPKAFLGCDNLQEIFVPKADKDVIDEKYGKLQLPAKCTIKVFNATKQKADEGRGGK